MAAKDITIGSQGIASHLGISEREASEAIDAVYQAAFEVGFGKGLEAGLKEAREAAVAQLCAARHDAEAHQVPNPRVAPERRLLGLPCANCRIYSSTEEALCPCWKTPKVSTQNGRNQFAVTGDTSVSLTNIAASTRPMDTESSSSSEEELQLQL